MSNLQAEVTKRQKVTARNGSAGGRRVNNIPVETERLLLQKRDLLSKFDQRKEKQARNQRSKEQFRGFLFSNLRVAKRSRTTNQQGVDDVYEHFESTPSNLNSLYFDSIEGKNFTQIKIDLFSTTIRKQIDGFLHSRDRILGKINDKNISLQIMGDLN